MAGFYYQEKQWERQTVLRLLALLNLAFALAVLAAWHFVGAYVAEPTASATGGALSSTTRPNVNDYPFVLLWASPLAATFLAWFAFNVKRFALARQICVYPLLLFSLAYIWHYYHMQFGF